MPNIDYSTLPIDEARRLAHAAGATIGTDNAIMSDCYYTLFLAWVDRYIPRAGNGESDEAFGERLDAIGDEFRDGFNGTFPEKPTQDKSSEYKSGLRDAVSLLQTWKTRGEEGSSPGLMMQELIAAYYGRCDAERQGFSDGFMCWIACVLEGGVPDVDGSWKVEEDLALWGASVD